MERLWKIGQEAIKKGAEGDLPWIVVLITFVGLQIALIKFVYRPWVDSKNEEIKRLVEERDKFQDMFLKNRLHAGLDDKGNRLPATKAKDGKRKGK